MGKIFIEALCIFPVSRYLKDNLAMNRILNGKLFSHTILNTSLHCLSTAIEKCVDILILVLFMVAFFFHSGIFGGLPFYFLLF